MLDYLVMPFIVFMVVLFGTCMGMNEKDDRRETLVAEEIVEPPELW